MKPYIPSKVCPHRYCRRVHLTMTFTGLVAGLTGTDIWMQVVCCLALLMNLYAWRTRHRDNLPAAQLQIERPNQYLMIRRGWARAALTLDILLAGAILLMAASNIVVRATGLSPQGLAARHSADGTILTLIASLTMAGYIGLIVMCHWMASKPGKPNKVRLPRNTAFQSA